ncbi:exosome complex component RRP46-like protein, partial [Leptotrombidium deliense]
IGNWIKTALEEVILTNVHPHTIISIIVQEVENDGAVLAAAVNSTCCALLDAGIPMKCLIAAMSVTIATDGSLILDSRHKEGDEFQAMLTFAFESLNCKIISVTTQGSFTEKQFKKCAKLCATAAKGIFEFYENSIKQRFRA